jgi:hypothetical protein
VFCLNHQCNLRRSSIDTTTLAHFGSDVTASISDGVDLVLSQSCGDKGPSLVDGPRLSVVGGALCVESSQVDGSTDEVSQVRVDRRPSLVDGPQLSDQGSLYAKASQVDRSAADLSQFRFDSRPSLVDGYLLSGRKAAASLESHDTALGMPRASNNGVRCKRGKLASTT